MTRENVMSTPIFDQLLREMAEHAEPSAPAPTAEPEAKSTPAERPATTTRRRHRAE
jgi:hypothetical protein